MLPMKSPTNYIYKYLYIFIYIHKYLNKHLVLFIFLGINDFKTNLARKFSTTLACVTYEGGYLPWH